MPNSRVLLVALGFIGMLPLQVMALGTWTPASVVEGKVMTGSIAGLGEVRVRVDQVGEPLSRPIRIQIEVSCGEDDSYKVVLQDEKACDFRDLSFDPKTRSLQIRVGQYDPDAARCSGSRSLSVSLSKICPRR